MSEALARYTAQHTAYPMPYVLPAQQNFSYSLFDRFAAYAQVKDSTLKGYKNNIHAFSAWMQENCIAQPAREDIMAYADFLASCGRYKPGTQAAYLRTVKLFFARHENAKCK